MVNFGFNAASILGIVLFLAGGALYAMRSWKPEVSKDHDIFFAAVALICGGILFFHGWRLDPILQFCQLLLAGSAIFFVIESIRLRAFATTQVRGRSTASYVDNDRTSSRVYRAQLDQMEGYEDEYEEEEVPRRRLQGTAPRSSSRRSTYEEQPPRSRPRRPSNQPPVSRSRNNPPSRPSRGYDDWQDTPDHWEDDREPRRSSSRKPPSDVPPSSRSRKRRPKSADDIVSSVGTQYVDYQPLDTEGNNEDDDMRDNPSDRENFDY
ncbi:Ycf66 family protein [Geminocystis sp. CENA526]|uniref:Ycf66 family protein n=1 Tax=Geminocystis sp. CENA526 TaxID=1355871 RepID=UPI003D6E6F3D